MTNPIKPNSVLEDPIDVLVNCTMQDLIVLDYIHCDDDLNENYEYLKRNMNDEDSNLTFDADDLRDWLELDDDAYSINQDKIFADEFEPLTCDSFKPIEKSNDNNENEIKEATNTFRGQLIESLKKLESSMRKTEMSRREIMRHKSQSDIMMRSSLKFHKRQSLIVKPSQARRRLSDFAPQLTSKRHSLSYSSEEMDDTYRKRSSLIYELESKRRLGSLRSYPKSNSALTA